jgi:D-proline reductase (dithiol) PrdB
VSALAHFIEDEGIATTGISLVREHTAGYRPPRFLWVPFPLGRPFGACGKAPTPGCGGSAPST